MRTSDLILLLSLLDGSESSSPAIGGRRSPLRGMWRLFKFFLFLFLLIWFLLSQDFLRLEVKPTSHGINSVHPAASNELFTLFNPALCQGALCS